jgi:O-antigen ligase
VVLVLLVVIAGAAAAIARRPIAAPDDPARWTRRLGPVAAGVAVAVAIGLVVGGLSERPSAAELAAGASAARLTSVSSNRYEYWRVGERAFAEHLLAGLGSGGFRAFWLRERPIPEPVKDIHSLELEMAVELGLIGLLAFAAMVAGVAMAARRALGRHRALAAGWCAAAVVWLLHASIDWDWELPAVSLPAIVLAGALIALAESSPEPLAQPERAPTGSRRRSAARARAAAAGSS